MKSPSSRRAWIEIQFEDVVFDEFIVALLAEGVDRNRLLILSLRAVTPSPSSRRAWIEIV